MEYIVNSAEWHYQQILKQLGYDVNREGLIETPKRHIKFLREFLLEKEFAVTTFEAESKQMIVQKNIQFYSLCEHHVAPFFGVATVAYIPKDKILGLSKIARIVDKFSNRLQNQERITKQIAGFIQSELDCLGVAVKLNGKHLCMCMRGVKKEANTETFYYTGVFVQRENLKNEFLLICN